MKKVQLVLSVLMFSFVILSGCSNRGTELEFKGTQLFYTSNITEAEANALGNYLVANEFSDGTKKSVQIDKSGAVYQFRMVVMDGLDLESEENIEMAKSFGASISADIFNGQKVEVHYCDDQFKTLKVVPMAVL